MALVPTQRLILALAAVLIPCALVLAFVPGSAMTVAAVALAALVVVVIDALRAYGSLDSLRASIPAVIRATRDGEAAIDITIEQPVAAANVLQIGLALPESVRSPQDSMLVRMPADAPKAAVTWTCTPSERGNFELERLHVGTASPWGLWDHHRAAPVAGTLRVYPNVQQERRNLAAIFLDRSPYGVHARRHLGKGREFEQLREYLHGDSLDDVHWKATARRAKPVTKIYQVERTQEVYAVIDSSRLSAATLGQGEGGSVTTNLERCINAALVLGLVAEKQGDLFGLITFDKTVNRFIKARNGRAHFNACRDAIYGIETTPHNPNFAELFSYIRVSLRKRALIIILTNLSDPMLAESFSQSVDLVARNHLILVNAIADPGVQPVFAKASVSTADDIYARLGGHVEWTNLQKVRQTLRLRNVSLNFLAHETLSADVVSQYLNQKQRQLL